MFCLKCIVYNYAFFNTVFMYYLVMLLNFTLKSHPKVYTKVIKLSKTLCVRQPLFTLKSVIKVSASNQI